MDTWPSSLPQYILRGPEIKLRCGLANEDAEINAERTRTYPEYETEFQMVMTSSQLATFKTFWNTTLNQVAPFTAPWLETLNFDFHYLRFREAPKWELKGLVWIVSLPVEIMAGVETDSSGDPDIYPPEAS